MNITRGKKQTQLKLVVYGPEGVGKTTFAAQAPGVVFIDTEGSTNHMDVARTDPPKTWKELMDQVKWFCGNSDKIGTLAIDTLDWAEKLAIQDVCREKEIDSIETIPYGKGYVFVKDRFIKLMEALDELRNKGVHIILTAHAQVKKFEQPDELGSYDRYALKLNEKNISPLIKEWSDILLFANFRTDIVTDDKTKTRKATGGKKRVMYTTHSACWDAKNRFGLPDEMPFDFAQIAALFGEAAPVAEVSETKQPPAEVTTVEKAPEPKSALAAKVDKAAARKTPAERPESMKSDNPEKDELLMELWEKMRIGQVKDPAVIQAVVAEKEYYDASTPIRDYDIDFIEGCLIEAWDKVLGLALTKQNDLPF